jgi:tetratricopeptide (TPR) repeat protein
MKCIKATLLSVLSVVAAFTAQSSAIAQESNELSELIADGDSLYAQNDYSGSAAIYQEAAALDSNSIDAYWKLGRSLNLIGETAPRDSQEAIFQAARKAEVHALSLNENSAEAHFQLARAAGKIALFKGVFNSIGLAKQVRREAERALEIDSLHDGAWHVLGRWHREIGKKPKLVRGPLGLGAANKRDAVAFMEKAITLNPANINHHLEMGITYLEYDNRDGAEEQFRLCATLPAERPLDNKYKEEAKKYLAEMDKR